MLTPELIAELDRSRFAPGTSVCPAPTINLHFSQLGVVTACCFNRQHVLGVYPRDSVADLWRGQPIRELRAALDAYDLSKGCDKCLQQIQARDFGGSHAVFYSNYAKIAEDKRRQLGIAQPRDPVGDPMPMRLEFNIHNSCNLECVMCHGLASSAIRTNRDGMAALPCPYDDAFVDQLEPFLPYVVDADFLGGEPFLISVYVRLWERIAQCNPSTQCCILTNGTILDDRIKGILEGFNCWIHVSIDSIVPETYETIRRGASYERVRDNCRYFVDLMRRRGRSVIFRFCPMTLNWREIPATVEYCNGEGIELMFNQVDSPLSLSLHTLPIDELRGVVDYLEKRIPPPGTDDATSKNHRNYVELVQRLTGFLDPANRLAGLRARLGVTDAVVGRYTKHRKRGETPELEESTNTLMQAAKRYQISRLNVDGALATDGEMPGELTGSVDRLRRDLMELAATTGEARFIATYLRELVRNYTAVWGVLEVHAGDVFDRIDELAAAVESRPDRRDLVSELVRAHPGDLYADLSSRSVEELSARYLGRVEG